MSIGSISFGIKGHESEVKMGDSLPSLPSYLVRSLKIGNTSIDIPKGISTNAGSPVGEILSELVASKPTTGPTPQQISEALGKIHGIIGGHPHLGTEFSEEIYEALHPESAGKPEDISEGNKAALEIWEAYGFIDDKGTLDFTKLGLTPKQIREANLSGKVWLDDEGNFQMDVTFNFGEEAFKALSALKERVNETFQPLGENSPISINPEDARDLGPDALAALEHDGQIQFKSLPNGKTLKLILDPGKDGKDDGLTVEVWDKGNRENPVKRKKIPLSVVFEGQEYHGRCVQKNGHPILEGWRSQELFQKSVVHTDKERIVPFTARFDRIVSDNTNNPARIQAQNTLWAAVRTYLGATVSPEEQEAQQTSEQQTAQEESVLKAILKPGNESKPETAKIVAKAGKLPKEPLRTKNLIDAGKQVVDAVKRLEESLRLQTPSSDSGKPLSSTLQLAEEQAPTHIQPERAKEIVTPEDVPEVAEVVVPKAQAVEINTQAINPTVIKDLSQALSSLRRGLENLPDGPDDIYKAFEELKNNLKELQDNVPELFSNPLFLQQAQKNNPELFEKIQPGLAQLQKVTASILANIKDHATSAPNDELSEIFELIKSVNAAVNQLLVKTEITESDDILNAAKDLVAGGLKDLVAGLPKPDSPIGGTNPNSAKSS